MIDNEKRGKETNIKAIRDTSMALFDAVQIREPEGLKGMGIVQHPFVSTIFWTDRKGNTISFLDPSHIKKCRGTYHDAIYTGTVGGIYCMVRNPFKMTWFNYCSHYLDDEDYGKYLRDSWTMEENPNQDVNVPRRKAIQLFKKAKKTALMRTEEYEYYKDLPDKLTVWRGVSPGRERLGLSWTTDRETAAWFMSRFETKNRKGSLLEAAIDKKDVLAYFNGRNEKEIVVDVFKIKNRIREI